MLKEAGVRQTLPTGSGSHVNRLMLLRPAGLIRASRLHSNWPNCFIFLSSPFFLTEDGPVSGGWHRGKELTSFLFGSSFEEYLEHARPSSPSALSSALMEGIRWEIPNDLVRGRRDQRRYCKRC